MRVFIFLATLCLGLILYQFPLSLDLTKNKINSLNTANQSLLSGLKQPLTIDLYSTNPKIITEIKTVLTLFQKESAFVKLNLHKNPLEAFYKKRFNLKTPHQLALSYSDRFKVFDINLETWNQNTLGHLIQQMIRLKEEWIVFMTGHGEGEAFSQTHEGFSLLTDTLKSLGFNVATLNLTNNPIPDNTKMLVLPHPKTAFLAHEIKTLLEYIDQGGNLLWLMHPDSETYLQKIHTKLGVRVEPYLIMNTPSHVNATDNTDKNRLNFSFVTQYPGHVITHDHHLLTVFPNAYPLSYEKTIPAGFKALPFLTTTSKTHLENHSKRNGPFTLGITLEKAHQRIAIVGNTAFLNNSALHHYGNLSLATNLFNWLTDSSDGFNPYRLEKPVFDLSFRESHFTKTILNTVFPVFLPLFYLGIGWFTYRNRRKKMLFS